MFNFDGLTNDVDFPLVGQNFVDPVDGPGIPEQLLSSHSLFDFDAYLDDGESQVPNDATQQITVMQPTIAAPIDGSG